eukprot:1368644-Amorphochlora_amoeboformis.AAC.2
MKCSLASKNHCRHTTPKCSPWSPKQHLPSVILSFAPGYVIGWGTWTRVLYPGFYNFSASTGGDIRGTKASQFNITTDIRGTPQCRGSKMGDKVRMGPLAGLVFAILLGTYRCTT